MYVCRVSGIQTHLFAHTCIVRYKQVGAGMLKDDGSNIKHRHAGRMEMVNLAYDNKQRPIWKRDQVMLA